MTRLFVIGFGLVTGMILVLTVIHWPEFTADGLPHRPLWIFDYVVDPLLALVIVPAAGLWPPRHGFRHRLTPLLMVVAAVLGVLGLALLAIPDTVAAAWPWALPPLLGQLYACFFVTFAVGAMLAARESEAYAIRGFVLSTFTLMVLVLIVSMVHFDRFKSEPVTWLWFGAFAVGACAFGIALLTERSPGWLSHPATATE